MSGPTTKTLLALPMHGEAKLRTEGLRTRDGHLLEWVGRIRPDLTVHLHSRPEPWPRVTLARRRGADLPPTWRCASPEPLAVPPLRDRRRWWVTSARYDRPWPARVDAVLVWNPIATRAHGSSRMPIGLDLLDDWLIHPAFEGIRREVRRGYEEWFDVADSVTANSEGTLELARSFGRTDAVLVPNGCDPDRFSVEHTPGSRFTVGYGGKLSERLDVELLSECALAMPEVSFELAGPVMMRGLRRRFRRLDNVILLGDVPYPDYPRVMRGWDMAWVPHRVGRGEVGGDAIKLYEYRAAGLPTVTTKIIGWQRALQGVQALDRAEICPALKRLSAGGPGSLRRSPVVVPVEHTWRFKAEMVLDRLGI